MISLVSLMDKDPDCVADLDFSQYDCTAIGSHGNALMTLMHQNTEKSIYVKPKQWSYLIHNSDLSFINKKGHNALTYYISYNCQHKIFLKEEDANHIIQHSNIKPWNYRLPLTEFFKNKEKEQLNISPHTMDYFIENSQLNHLTSTYEEGEFSNMLFIVNKSNFLTATQKQFIYNRIICADNKNALGAVEELHMYCCNNNFSLLKKIWLLLEDKNRQWLLSFFKQDHSAKDAYFSMLEIMANKEKLNTYIEDKKGYKYSYFLKYPIIEAYINANQEKSSIEQEIIQKNRKSEQILKI